MIQTCSICEKEYILKIKEYRYIIQEEEFVCSPACVLKWIKESKNEINIDEIDGIYKINLSHNFCARSHYEQCVKFFLEKNNIKYEYEKIGIFLDKPINYCTYTPDFYLPDYGCFLEVKGLWEVGAKRKIELFRKFYPQIRLLILHWLLYAEFKQYYINN